MWGAYTAAIDWVPEAGFECIFTTESNNPLSLPSSSESVGNTRLFSKTGVRIATISAGVGNVNSNLYVGNYLGLVFGKTKNIQAFTITKKGTTYSLVKNAAYSLLTTHGLEIKRAVQNPNTNIIYFMGDTTTIRSYDFSTKSLVATNTLVDLFYNQYIGLIGGNYLAVIGISPYIFLIDRTSFSAPPIYFPADKGGKIGLEDNLDHRYYYLGQHEAMVLVKANVVDLDVTYSRALFLTMITGKPDNLLNFGQYQYLGVHEESTSAILLVRKISLTVASSNPAPTNIRFQTFRMNYQQDLNFYFSWLTDTGSFNNLIISRGYFTFPCLSRDPAFVCQSCSPSYYRDSVSPYNQCIQKADFLPAHGADDTNKLMVACQVGCLECVDLYTWCTLADVPRGYSLNSTDGTVYLTSNSSNSSTNVTVPPPTCVVLNCVECVSGDVTKCARCKFGYYLKDDSEDTCYQNNIPGYGRVSDNITIIKECQDSNCDECHQDYTTCDKCKASYHLDPRTNSTCFNLSQIPDGYGLNELQDSVEPCTDDNCQTCRDLNTNCTSCQSGFDLKTLSLSSLISGCFAQYVDPDVQVCASCLTDMRLTAEKMNQTDTKTFRIRVFANVTNVSRGMYAEYVRENTIGIQLYSKNGDPDKSTSVTLEKSPTPFGIILVGRFLDQYPVDNIYHVLVSVVSKVTIPLNGYNITIYGGDFNFSFPNPYDRLTVGAFEDMGGIFGLLTGSTLTGPVFTGSVVLLSLASPLNMLLLVTQSLRMFSRIYLINIEFGPKLGRFLSVICQANALFPGSSHQAYDVKNARGHLGKLTEKRFTTDFMGGFWILAGFYNLLWVWRLLKLVILRELRKPPAWFAIMSYMISKAHVCFLLLFLSDLVLFSGLSMNYLKGLNTSRILGGWVFTLLILEMLHIHHHLTAKSNWRHIIALHKDVEENQPTRMKMIGRGSTTEITEGSSPMFSSRDTRSNQTDSNLISPTAKPKSGWRQKTSKIGQKKMNRMGKQVFGLESGFHHLSCSSVLEKQQTTKMSIDNPATLAHMRIDHAVCSQAYTMIKIQEHLDGTNFSTRVFFYMMMRISLFQVLILGSQRLPVIVLAGFFLFELIYLGKTLSEYFRTKFIKSILDLLLATSQTSAMAGFLGMAACTYAWDTWWDASRHKVQDGDSFQVAGVVFILGIVGIEYLILAIQLLTGSWCQCCSPSQNKKNLSNYNTLSWILRRFNNNPLFFKETRIQPELPVTGFARKLKFKARCVTKPDGTFEGIVTSSGDSNSNIQINLQVNQYQLDSQAKFARSGGPLSSFRGNRYRKNLPPKSAFLPVPLETKKSLKSTAASNGDSSSQYGGKVKNVILPSPFDSELPTPLESSKQIVTKPALVQHTHPVDSHFGGTESPLKKKQRQYSKIFSMGPRRLKTQASS